MTRVLCIAPHPDDESIGAGGTLAQHAAAGDEVRIVWLTSGEAAGEGPPDTGLAVRREAEARLAATQLGAEVGGFWRLADGGLAPDASVRARLAAALVGIDVLYAPHPDDGHPDHQVAARLAAGAATDAGVQGWGYEVWTPIATPTWVNDISDHVEAKLAAIRAHASQLAVIAFDAAAEGLARYRAELHCWPGTPTHAEAFAALTHDR